VEVVAPAEAVRLRRWQRPVVALALAVLVACLPIVTSAAVAIRAGWAPPSDEAAIQILTLDVGTERTPLVGMPTTLVLATEDREPGNQPGPLQFWLLSPLLRIVSAGPGGIASIAAAQAMLNIAIITTSLIVVWRARRLSRDPLLGGVFIASGLWIAGGDVAVSPWNPNAALVALLAACVAAAACHLGRRPTALAVLALSASLAAQAHLIYAVAALVVGIAGAIPVIRGARKGQRLVRLTPALIVLALAWSGPIIDIATNGGGNLSLLLARPASDRPAVGAARAFDTLSTHVLPWRAALHRQPTALQLGAPASLVDLGATASIIVVLGFAAMRGRSTWLARTCLAAMVLLTTMTAASPASPSMFFPYLQRVWIPVTIVIWTVLTGLAIKILVGSAIRRATWERMLQRALPIAVVAALLAGVAPLVRESSVIRTPYCNEGIRTLAEALPELDGRKVVLNSVDVPLWTLKFHSVVVFGLYAELVRRGADARLAVGNRWEAIPGELGDRLIRLDEPWPDGAQVITVVGRDQPAPASGKLLVAVTGETCSVAGDQLEVRLYG